MLVCGLDGWGGVFVKFVGHYFGVVREYLLFYTLFLGFFVIVFLLFFLFS